MDSDEDKTSSPDEVDFNTQVYTFMGKDCVPLPLARSIRRYLRSLTVKELEELNRLLFSAASMTPDHQADADDAIDEFISPNLSRRKK